jgi:hypothetical protein
MGEFVRRALVQRIAAVGGHDDEHSC